MKKSKSSIFSIFRYQLLPTTTEIQPSIFPKEYTSVEELVSIKNKIFYDIITNDKISFRGKGYTALKKIEKNDGTEVIIRLGVEKIKELHRKDFEKTSIQDYPNILIYVNNNPEKQYIIIENNTEAFSDPIAVSNIILKSVESYLSSNDLAIYIEQKFDVKEFWQTIELYKDKITEIKFQFLKPNISSISEEIKKAFQGLDSSTNSHKSTHILQAPVNGILENINENNERVVGILDYQKEGGGPAPTIRIRGLRKSINTVKSELTIEIKEFNGSAEELSLILKNKNY